MAKLLKCQGFHLLEILITLTLTAIMSQWMLGKYQYFIAKARRQEAKQALLALASALENYGLQHNGYADATLQNCRVNASVAANHYKLVIHSATGHRYQIAAYPLDKQARLDAGCGVLTLTSTGEKRVSGSSPVSYCW